MQKGRGRVSKGARPGKRANKETRGEESIVRNGERKEIGFLKKKKKKKGEEVEKRAAVCHHKRGSRRVE